MEGLATQLSAFQRVRIGRRDAAILERVHNGETCQWHPKMQKYIGKVGIIDRITVNGHARVSFFERAEGSNASGDNVSSFNSQVLRVKWTVVPAALESAEQLHFAAGDHVLVLGESDSLKAGGVDTNKLSGKLATVTVPCAKGNSVAFVAVEKLSPDSLSTDYLVPVYDHGSHSLFRDPQYGPSRNDSCERLLFGDTQPVSVEEISKLASAAREGDQKFILEFVHRYSEHVDVALPDDERRTALMIAAENGQHRVSMLLMLAGARWDNPHPNSGNTPIHFAVKSKQKETLKTLLVMATDVNQTNANGETALHLAVKSGNVCCVQLLLNKSQIDVNAQDRHGHTALHLAVEKGFETLVQVLLNCPTLDAFKPNKSGFAAIHLAAMQGHLKSLVRMLSHHDNLKDVPKPDGLTPLHLAAINGQLAVVDNLIEGNCDVNAVSNDGRNALHWAVSWNNRIKYQLDKCEIVHKLLSAKVDVNRSEKQQSDTSMHLAMRALHDAIQVRRTMPTPSIIEQLCGFSAENFDKERLSVACSGWPQLLTVAYLVNGGASLCARNRLMNTPVDCVPCTQLNRLWNTWIKSFPCDEVPLDQMWLEAPTCSFGFCNEAPCNVIFYPCEHKIMCGLCVQKVPIKRCHKCQGVIESCTDGDGKEIVPGLVELVGGNEMPEHREMMEKMEELENAVTCAICMDRRLGTVFDCGHMTCKKCSQDLHQCHICRKPIRKRIDAYPHWN